jgi:hypothetical protein
MFRSSNTGGPASRHHHTLEEEHLQVKFFPYVDRVLFPWQTEVKRILVAVHFSCQRLNQASVQFRSVLEKSRRKRSVPWNLLFPLYSLL